MHGFLWVPAMIRKIVYNRKERSTSYEHTDQSRRWRARVVVPRKLHRTKQLFLNSKLLRYAEHNCVNTGEQQVRTEPEGRFHVGDGQLVLQRYVLRRSCDEQGTAELS